jgi:hypothetical protein
MMMMMMMMMMTGGNAGEPLAVAHSPRCHRQSRRRRRHVIRSNSLRLLLVVSFFIDLRSLMFDRLRCTRKHCRRSSGRWHRMVRQFIIVIIITINHERGCV